MHMLSLIRYPRLIWLSIACICVASVYGQKDISDPFAASIEENISYPEVSSRLKPRVASEMAALETSLKSAGYATSRVRSGEVVMVTIPCASLFDPNDTHLKHTASGILSALIPYIRQSANYKIVVAAHSDNTGDSTYSDTLTEGRAAAVDDFFSARAQNITLIPYGLGSDEPLVSNTGFANRAANRRVEIYFVPTRNYIERISKH